MDPKKREKIEKIQRTATSTGSRSRRASILVGEESEVEIFRTAAEIFFSPPPKQGRENLRCFLSATEISSTRMSCNL